MAEEQRLTHPFPPLFGPDSEALILGSFPSVKSREQSFFYGHPQNRFWRVIAAVFEEDVPSSIEEKTLLILQNRLALWDSIRSCTITGSSDSKVERIFCNGALSHKMYMKYIYPDVRIKAVKLPSTSPANAAFSLDRLIREWSVLRKDKI